MFVAHAILLIVFDLNLEEIALQSSVLFCE